MEMNRSKLLRDLEQLTQQQLTWATKLESYSESKLNQKASPESWSALECLEHLNRYGEFYLPELRKRVVSAPQSSNQRFRTGVLGNYFAKSMQPKPGMKKMKTFAVMNPAGSTLTKATIETFKDQLLELQNLLKMAEQVDLTKTKTSISISKLIRLRLGDTFRFYTYHIERHLHQAQRATGIEN